MSQAYARASAVLVDEFDASGLNRNSDFFGGGFSPT
jgi:hypothetical protein